MVRGVQSRHVQSRRQYQAILEACVGAAKQYAAFAHQLA